jgi:hypothetical protein
VDVDAEEQHERRHQHDAAAETGQRAHQAGGVGNGQEQQGEFQSMQPFAECDPAFATLDRLATREFRALASPGTAALFSLP